MKNQHERRYCLYTIIGGQMVCQNVPESALDFWITEMSRRFNTAIECRLVRQ